MFSIGDKVVYPMHGGAIVTDIVKREQNGSETEYYVLKMLFEKMTVAVPVTSAERLGLRFIGDEDMLSELKAALREEPDIQAYKSISWNRRFQLYMERIKSGSIIEVAKIYKLLAVLDGCKKISVGERRLLHNTRQILESEIMLIRTIDAKEAECWLKECCN